MTLAIIDARDKEYVLVAAGTDLLASYVQQAIAAGQTAQEVLDAILAAGLSEGVFPSLAAGESGTTAGQYFWVGEAGTVVLYRNDAGVGTGIAELATAAGLALKANTADLAAPPGGEMVGFKQDGSGSVDRNISAKVKETLSSTDMGAVIDGATDDSDALIATFAQMAVTGRASLLSGPYKVTKPLTIPPGVIEGGNVVLDFTDADPGDFPDGICVVVQGGARTQIANLDTDLAIGDREFSFGSAHGLLAGETFNLSGTVDYAGNGYRSYYRKGEMFRVAEVVDPTTVIVENGCRDTYPAADVEVWKRSGDRFTQGCASLTIIGRDDVNYVARFESLDRATLSNLRCEGGYFAALSITDCFDAFVENVRARQTASGSSNPYGCIVGNSQGVTINGQCYGYFNGFTVGGSNPTGGRVGMNRDIHFNGHASSHPTNGLSGGNFHGNTEYSSLNGVFFNGISMGGNKNEAHGDFIKSSGGQTVILSEMHGADFTITGTLRSSGADLPTSSGAIHQSGMGAHLRYGGTTDIRLKFYAPNATRLVLYRPTGLVRTDVSLRLGLSIMQSHPSTRVIATTRTDANNEIPLIDFTGFEIVDNDVAITWSTAAATKMRGMTRTTNVSVSGTGVTSATAAATFNPRFPRTPTILPSSPSPAFAGTTRLVASYSGASATGCTVAVATADNSSANISSTVSVVAQLNDQ